MHSSFMGSHAVSTGETGTLGSRVLAQVSVQITHAQGKTSLSFPCGEETAPTSKHKLPLVFASPERRSSESSRAKDKCSN